MSHLALPLFRTRPSGLRARPLGRIWRCKNVEDPFKRCSQRGIPLQATHGTRTPGGGSIGAAGEKTWEGAFFSVPAMGSPFLHHLRW